jgi:DNA-binding PadR family transcriptional regulator
MDVKTLCLGVLTEGDASGYDIKKYFECTFSHFYVAGFGSIYPALAELTRKDLVACREESQSNRPDRKIYALTDAGREHFLKALQSTPPRHRIRSEFFVLLHFAHMLPHDRLGAVLDERLGDTARMLQELQQLQEDCRSGECQLEPAQQFEVELAVATLQTHHDYIARNRNTLLDSVQCANSNVKNSQNAAQGR